MSSKSQEALRKYEQAKNAYDKALDEVNRYLYELDMTQSEEKKKVLKKKLDAAREKLNEEDQKEKAAKRAYDAAS